MTNDSVRPPNEGQSASATTAFEAEQSLPALWVDMRENPSRFNERDEVFSLVGCLRMSDAALARLACLLQEFPWLCGVEDRALGYSPLRVCAAMGHWAGLKIMEKHAHVLDWQCASLGGDTALILAARDKAVKCAQILAPRSNLLAVDIWGRSAAMSAAYLGSVEILATLIDGSDALSIDQDGLDLLGCAAGSGVAECCDLVLLKLSAEHPAQLLDRARGGSSRARALNYPLLAARIEEMSLALLERAELGGFQDGVVGHAGSPGRAMRI